LPTLVINYISSNKQKPFPYDKLFNDVEIIKFLDENLTNKLTGGELE
jgi:hypothetical protein